MEHREPSLFWSLAGNVWLMVCVVASVSCVILAIRLLPGAAPGIPPGFRQRLALAVPALFGGLAGFYGVITTVVLAVRSRRLDRSHSALRRLEKRVGDLEALRLRQQARLEELSTLREVATVVNQESDFGIISEKVLELIHGLLEPRDIALFIQEGDKEELQPFAQYTEGKVLTGRKMQTREIPDFDLAQFESHGVICRARGRELHAIVPLKVEESILGAVLLVFPTDGRPPEVQREEFNKTRRRALLEIAHHISLAVKTKHLHTRAVVDELTQLYSRSHFNTQLQALMEFSRRNGETFSVLLIDIDHFKRVNDTYGHTTGDIVLRRLANRIRSTLRKYDTGYRYGGEELAVFLPRTRMKQAIGVAERFRNLIESQKFRSAGGKLLHVTVSVGVAQFEPTDDVETLFSRADRRLYQAKHDGRNRVVPAAAA